MSKSGQQDFHFVSSQTVKVAFILRNANLSSNGNLHFHTSLDVDDDLLDNLGRSVEVYQTLVDSARNKFVSNVIQFVYPEDPLQ